ncbi:MAG: DUF3102 domain-containing protein [Rhodospirillales bacterium]|nr:DUF3102 domain-containing protein [Rhodospirillales bacterium]
MTTEIALYQTLAPDQAALAMRAEERIKARTVVTVIENGRDLLEVKNALGHGLFTQWLAQTFPFTARTAQRWMNAAEQYGAKSDLGSLLNSKVLQLLAAPSTPEDVREEIEARATAGEKITVAEVERLKREARAAEEMSFQIEGERAAMRAVVEQARRDVESARAKAVKARAAAEDAVRQAREEAEQAAALKAEALAEEALARRRGELAEIEQRTALALEAAQAHQATARQWAADAERHREYLSHAGSAEREAPAHIEAAEKLMAALSAAMIALHGFEHPPLPPVARKWAMARQMSGQMAAAIAAFLGPRLAETAR